MSNGKGSTYRPTDKKKFNEGWDRVFGKKTKKVSVDELMQKFLNYSSQKVTDDVVMMVADDE